MRKFTEFLLVISLVSFSATWTQADGLLHKLPADGAWAKYDMEWLGPSPAGELMILRQGTMTVSSVGTEMVDEEQCRWIEIPHIMVFNPFPSV